MILIPSLAASGVYLFSGENLYANLYNPGNRINIVHETFEITKIKPILKVMNISSFGNFQGGTCYQNYYVLCSNNFECIIIYDMETKKVEHTLYTNQTNTDYHCNTCFFGSDFYSAQDKFPILYISMENAPVHSTIGYRIYQRGTSLEIVEVCRLVLTYDTGYTLYYPNSYYDYSNNMLYYGGYTKNSYRKSNDNKLEYHVFALPDYRLGTVELKLSESFDHFTLDSETATQGGFISDGYLYETFSFHNKNDAANAPKFRLVDLREKKIIKEYSNLGEQFGYYDEFENIAISMDGHLYAHGNYTTRLYEFEYKGDLAK